LNYFDKLKLERGKTRMAICYSFEPIKDKHRPK